MRLDKYVSNCTGKGRTEVKALIKSANITVNGEVCKKADTKLSESDIVCLNAQPIEAAGTIFIMLNKPKGIVCACKDKRDTTVIDLISDEFPMKDLFPAGRLDKDSTGLVLITNDGKFAHNILAPKKHVGKTYEVTLDTPLTNEIVAAFESGVTLVSGEKMKSAKLTIHMDNASKATVVITQGVYHQIKRMFGVFGIGVINLHRTAIGGLRLCETLNEGEYIRLNEDKITEIYN